MKTEHLREFLIESNKIEGIYAVPLAQSIEISKWFLKLDSIEIRNLEALLHIFQPGAKLRDKPGMDVRVGNHRPMRGGSEIPILLNNLLGYMRANYPMSPFGLHQEYENLHPFSDCNGRSGRMLWLWQMVNLGYGYKPELGFLHTFYYQSLEHGR